MLSFFPIPPEMACRFLVLVFAAMREEMALHTNQRGGRRHVEFRLIWFDEIIVYGIISHDSIETKGKST